MLYFGAKLLFFYILLPKNNKNVIFWCMFVFGGRKVCSYAHRMFCFEL